MVLPCQTVVHEVCTRSNSLYYRQDVLSAETRVCATSGHGETAGEVCYAGGRPPAAGGATHARESQERTTRLGHPRAERPVRAEAGHHRACDTASPPQEAVCLMTHTRHSLEGGSAAWPYQYCGTKAIRRCSSWTTKTTLSVGWPPTTLPSWTGPPPCSAAPASRGYR